MNRCRSCGRPIVWARSAKSGKPTPLDAAPVPGGDLEIVAGVARPVAALDRIVPLYRSHQVTCKFASKHRRKAT